jgi:hypothetical protein
MAQTVSLGERTGELAGHHIISSPKRTSIDSIESLLL